MQNELCDSIRGLPHTFDSKNSKLCWTWQGHGPATYAVTTAPPEQPRFLVNLDNQTMYGLLHTRPSCSKGLGLFFRFR